MRATYLITSQSAGRVQTASQLAGRVQTALDTINTNITTMLALIEQPGNASQPHMADILGLMQHVADTISTHIRPPLADVPSPISHPPGTIQATQNIVRHLDAMLATPIMNQTTDPQLLTATQDSIARLRVVTPSPWTLMQNEMATATPEHFPLQTGPWPPLGPQ